MALVVAAMEARGPWARRMRLMARLRRAAMIWGPLAVRSWWRSSSKTTSRTQWRRLYESAGGAVPSFPRVVSPGRSSEPGVPVSRHRALREPASGLWWRGCAGPLDRPGFCGGLVMPWRVPRRWWWCGCDGGGVRRRRVRGRRGWRGGVGCGWHRFTHWAVAVPGVVAVLPGAVAPERAPRLQGLAPGPGRRRLRRRSPRLRPMRPVPSSTSRPAWAMDRHWPPWWCRALEVAAVAVLAPPGSPARGRRPRCRCPVRLPAAQPTIRRENRPRDEGGAAEPRPGRHAGVGSAGGALPAFSRVGFRRPPSEPDVRIPAHPALHPCYAVAFAVQGLGMRVPR